jgi:hypothetical protein
MTRATINAAESSLVVTHYETLRRAALGDALPPEARSGLALFLRQGMWGWARAGVTIRAVPPPAGARLAHGQTLEEDRTIIHLFAALAITADH